MVKRAVTGHITEQNARRGQNKPLIPTAVCTDHKGLGGVKKSTLEVYDSIYETVLEMTKLQRWRTDRWLPRVRDGRLEGRRGGGQAG